MATWRMAGLNYVNYSNIAARTLRRSLKATERAEAAKRDTANVTYYYWVDGEMLPKGQKPGADTSASQAEAMAAKG